jgi:hypothetical protein
LLLPLLARAHRHRLILRTMSVDTSQVFAHVSRLAPRPAKALKAHRALKAYRYLTICPPQRSDVATDDQALSGLLRTALKLWARTDSRRQGPEVRSWEVGAITQTSYRIWLWFIPSSRPVADCVSCAWTRRAFRCGGHCEPDGRGCHRRWWDRRSARASAKQVAGK